MRTALDPQSLCDVPIVVTLCAIVQNLSWAMLGTNVCHWVACYLCIWLQEQLFVLGGFGM